jgi:hypothetical protein
MSGLPPSNGHWSARLARRFSTSGLMHRSKAESLFDHLVGGNEHGWRHVEAEAFAVLRLSTFSYFTGACTGRSAGFSPLRMRSNATMMFTFRATRSAAKAGNRSVRPFVQRYSIATLRPST